VGPKGWLLSVSAAAAIALAVALLVVTTRDSNVAATGSELVAGQIYSTDAGDPVDVVYEIDESGTGCMSLRGVPHRTSGIPFGGSTLCFSLKEVDEGGMYRVLLPASVEDPALVVGVLPHGATGAIVNAVGWKTTRANVRGRWFLASLEPAPPDVLNLEPLRVQFEY
jgi:hypothetical protein